MVLSHMKLKQKFRSLLSESLASAESNDSCNDASAAENVNHELQRVRELLGTKSRRPNPNFKKKGKAKPLSEDSSKKGNFDNGEIGKNEGSVDLKRQRGDEGAQESAESSQKKKKKKQKTEGKKKEKQKKKKKKKKEIRLKKMAEKVNMQVEKIKESVLPVQVNESEVKKVYVGGIPYYSSEDDIISFFEGCGTVTEVDCMRFPETGKFRGIAILTFKTEAAAKRALDMDGADMGGFYLKTKPYKAARNPKSDFAPEFVEGYNRVYVGNLSWDISEDNLKQLFSDCKISSIRFGADKETGDFKGYAHIDFADSVSLAIALKFDEKIICGRPIRIRCAVPKKAREANSSSRPNGNKHDGGKVEEEGSTSGKSKQKKRRTCYECGTPGHLSSECPNKRVSGDDNAAS